MDRVPITLSKVMVSSSTSTIVEKKKKKSLFGTYELFVSTSPP